MHIGKPLYDPLWTAWWLGNCTRHRWLMQNCDFTGPVLIGVRHPEPGHDAPTNYDWGFRYDDGCQLMRAARLFQPDFHDEPVGYRKRATHTARAAPNRDEAREYNRPRCVHGFYLHGGFCRTSGDFCPDAAAFLAFPGNALVGRADNGR